MDGIRSFGHDGDAVGFLNDAEKPGALVLRGRHDSRAVGRAREGRAQEDATRVLQKSNCVAVMPEGTDPIHSVDLFECILLDVP